MVHVHGKLRLKWTPDWPVTMRDPPSANDDLGARKQGERSVHIALFCAFTVALVVAGFHHSAFGF
jgi:hypothetical protein